MNGFGRKIIKSILMVGAFAVGFAMNSTDSKAEEIVVETNLPEQTEEANDQTEQTDVTNMPILQDNLQTETQSEDPRILEMQDYAGVIEGDLVAAEGYLETANEAVEQKTLTEETSEEIIGGAEAVQEQAEEKAAIIRSIADWLGIEAERATMKFEDESDYLGLKDYYYRYNAASDPEEKEQIYNEALAATRYGAAEKEYNELGTQLDELEEQRKIREADALNNLDVIQQEHEELEELETQFSSEEPGSLGSAQQYYQVQLDKLSQFEAEMNQSCEEFDQVYYARGEREENVQTTEANKQEAIQNVKDAVANEADDDELSTKITDCASAIELYNQAVDQLEKWYTQLEETIVKRRDKVTQYNNQKDYVKTIEQGGILEKITRYLDLKERYSDYASVLAAAQAAYAQACSDADQQPIKEKRAFCLNTMQNTFEEYDYYKTFFDDYKNKIVVASKANTIRSEAEANLQQVKNLTVEIETVIASYVPASEKISKAVDEMKKNTDEINDAKSLDEAQEKNEAVHNGKEQIQEATDTLYSEFNDQAKDAGFEEYSEKFDAAETTEEKLTIIDELTATIKNKLDTLSADVISTEYDKIVAQITELETKLANTIAEINKAGKELWQKENFYYYLCDITEPYNEYTRAKAAIEAEREELAKERDAELRKLWESRPIWDRIVAKTDAYYEKINEIYQASADYDIPLEDIFNYSDRSKRDDIFSKYFSYEVSNKYSSYYEDKYQEAVYLSSEPEAGVCNYYLDLDNALYEKLRFGLGYYDTSEIEYYREQLYDALGYEYDSEIRGLQNQIADLTNKKYTILLKNFSSLNQLNSTLQEVKTTVQLNEKADEYLAEADSNLRHATNYFIDEVLVDYQYSKGYETIIVIGTHPVILDVKMSANTKVMPSHTSITTFDDLIENAKEDFTAHVKITMYSPSQVVIASTEKDLLVLV